MSAAKPPRPKPTSNSTAITKSKIGGNGTSGDTRSRIMRLGSSTSSTGPTSAATSSGAVDEAVFLETFESTPEVQLLSGKDVDQQLSNVRETLADTNNDWEKRVDALKRLRSIIVSGAADYDEFFKNMRQLDLPLATTVKDLRSQIVREACITLAFMSVKLTNRFERTAEGVIPALMNLIQNSAKVISTSGIVAMRFIVDNTQSSKLVPLILGNFESKSKEIRRHTCELLLHMLSHWDRTHLDKHGQLIHDSIKKSLSDPDPEARQNARKAFGLFREYFSQLADQLLNTLDASKKKMLLGEMSNSSSTHSLAIGGRMKSAKETTPRYQTANDKQYSPGVLARSSSANELASRNFAKDNATSMTTSTTPVVPSPLIRPRPVQPQSIYKQSSTTAVSSTSRPPITSQSQPGSRSTSPTLKAHYLTHHNNNRTPTNGRSRIPVSGKISSRESSPGRTRPYGVRQGSNDYDSNHFGVSSQRRGAWGADSDDNASETSSICSERSLEDVADVLRRMSSNEWAERKEGLTTLYHMIRSGRVFSSPEIKRITEIFSKRFHDPHTQVFTAFLDVLPEFIVNYKREINEWLYTLLTKLLGRLGNDHLESTYKKLKHCLNVVNQSFDVHQQFTILTRFINDNSLAPGVKAKEVLLRHLQQIIQHMEPVDIANNADVRIALSKIMNWSVEPKSNEVRKAAQGVVLALYNLNRPEFTLMLTSLPDTYQTAASKIIRSVTDKYSSTYSNQDMNFLQRSNSGVPSPMTTSVNSLLNSDNNHDQLHQQTSQTTYLTDMRVLMENMQALNINHRNDDLLTSSNSLKDSGFQDMAIRNGRQYTPQLYRSNRAHNTTEHSDSILNASDRTAAIDSSLDIANNTTLSKEQRYNAMRCILKFSKVNDNETWDIAFTKTLNVLTQILDNDNDDMTWKVYSLRIIRELLIHHTNLFMNYVELTIIRILKAQSETESDITRAAEAAALAAAEHLPSEGCVRVLKPIIETAKYPMNQAAITMLQKTIELMNKDVCARLMPEMIPPLLAVWDIHSRDLDVSWDSETSSVRKAAVFCLVAVFLVVGESLRTYLQKLSASKLKLLNVYISKAEQQRTVEKNTNSSSSPTTTTNGKF
ncbi:unnamed protein product [Didymodactylos carnosus]|uniref:TOG domain-containing protein n=1 Tax=Didymodactylos carnosus TaxID=1234261 RepID=A0A813PQT1_9BILA|nr:unnamed protein product [Didymodactylos carnosus]CAF0754731.1 unnamed protein product [Didymodactylos carnosus]CAF3496774.1 unnamed protein product [Didymodactylos carnosus]CAF3534951.1 unnamed protein product [Didymodactylos carnosus]